MDEKRDLEKLLIEIDDVEFEDYLWINYKVIYNVSFIREIDQVKYDLNK